MSKLHPAWDKRRRLGDRFDGELIRDLDPMHVVMPVIFPNRCDSEAYFNKAFDITALKSYANKLNEAGAPVHHTPFHLMVACVIKLIYLRPKLNRFIANQLMYQRNEVTASFDVRKQFADDSGESLTMVNATPTDTLDDILHKVAEQITSGRSDEVDPSSQTMELFSSVPRRVTRAAARAVCLLERIGHCPKSFIETDPFYSSVLLSNIGSLGMDACYHHLANWGTTSLFITVGRYWEEEVEVEGGGAETRTFAGLGLTIDERLADGYYYAKSLDLLQHLFEHPELLERPMCEALE